MDKNAQVTGSTIKVIIILIIIIIGLAIIFSRFQSAKSILGIS